MGGRAVSSDGVKPSGPGTRTGRPRDPAIDERVLSAARLVYRDVGHAGFHFDAVAKVARVSRDALYRRYASSDALLLAALEYARWPVFRYESNRSLRVQLTDFATNVYHYFSSVDGGAHLRLHVEANRIPEVFREYRQRLLEPQLVAIIQAVDAHARAEGMHDLDAGELMLTLSGAVMMRALVDQDTDNASLDPIMVDNLIEGALRGATFRR